MLATVVLMICICLMCYVIALGQTISGDLIIFRVI